MFNLFFLLDLKPPVNDIYLFIYLARIKKNIPVSDGVKEMQGVNDIIQVNIFTRRMGDIS